MHEWPLHATGTYASTDTSQQINRMESQLPWIDCVVAICMQWNDTWIVQVRRPKRINWLDGRDLLDIVGMCCCAILLERMV